MNTSGQNAREDSWLWLVMSNANCCQILTHTMWMLMQGKLRLPLEKPLLHLQQVQMLLRNILQAVPAPKEPGTVSQCFWKRGKVREQRAAKASNITLWIIVNCLPFGAVASVHNFNRVARLVWSLGVKLLQLSWLNYYDDFPMVSPAAKSTSTMFSAKSFLHILGFKFSEAKLEPFGSEAEILGVVVGSNNSPADPNHRYGCFQK